MHPLARLDHQYVWHPFTQMRDWLKQEPIVIVEGEGAVLRDAHGREYLDGNASIWTNLHGHNHPVLNRALTRQLGRIAHSSALGLASRPAAELARDLVEVANAPSAPPTHAASPEPGQPLLAKVFFSDDGSTAIEVALKLAYECARRAGRSRRPRFLSLAGAYHGDTVGAVSLGHIDLFHRAYAGLLFRSDTVMAPYCYRCPFNRARPERVDARVSRRCRWECVGKVEARFKRRAQQREPYAGFVLEPLIQGAAGMIAQPAGWLRRVVEIARAHDTPWIADEVMTGFGRTGVSWPEVPGPAPRALPGMPRRPAPRPPRLFACQSEGERPDYLAVAKGLTGGYLPMAATLTTSAVFDAFLGDYAEFKTFFHGHSFTGNQLGAAAARASLALLHRPAAVAARRRLESDLAAHLASLWASPWVGDIRQVGLIAGIELVRDWRTREPFPLAAQAGIRVTAAMARRGVLTRPIGSVLVLMPPYCTTRAQVARLVEVMRESIHEALGSG